MPRMLLSQPSSPAPPGSSRVGHSGGICPGVVVLLFALTCAAPLPVAAREGEEAWIGNSRLVRLSREEARQHLGRADDFTRALSPFDRASRLERADDPGDQVTRQFFAEQAEEWLDEDWQRVVRAADRLRARLAQLPPLPWPAEIRFITTTGREEGQAPYCRGPAVILPRPVLGRAPEALERVLTHELFHILSNQNPAWRQRVYAIIGFVTGPEIPLPPDLQSRKITNPDGPRVDCRVELQIDGEAVTVAPVLLSTVERYDPAQGGSFFRYLKFQLLVVEPAGGDRWRPQLRDGKPVLLDPDKTPAYFVRIGRNTRYIIHPDEILADNFVHLVQDTPKLTHPELLGKLRDAMLDK
ncbi:MAG: hypothetical protein U0935_01175 [Pirellulales bacterium]